MKNLLATVIKYVVPAALVITVLFLSVTYLKSCKTIDQLSLKLGAYRARVMALDASAATLAQERKELQAKHDALLAKHATVAADSAAKDGQLAVGSSERARLRQELAGLKDQGLIIINLTAQVSSLESDLSLAIKDRDDWKSRSTAQDVIIFDLRAECATAVAQYETEHKARLDCESITSGLIGKNKWTQLEAAAAKALLVVLGVVVVTKVI